MKCTMWDLFVWKEGRETWSLHVLVDCDKRKSNARAGNHLSLLHNALHEKHYELTPQKIFWWISRFFWFGRLRVANVTCSSNEVKSWHQKKCYFIRQKWRLLTSFDSFNAHDKDALIRVKATKLNLRVAVILLKYEKSVYKTYIFVVVWRVLHVISDYLPRLPSKGLKIGLGPTWIGHDFRGQFI
jgi:hypothetical protein